MAKNNSKFAENYAKWSGDGKFSNGDGKFSNGDEWYELDKNALEGIAGGAGQYYGSQDYDTYRFWRDSNGVLREVR